MTTRGARSLSVATEPHAEQAALATLARGNALDAVVTGVLAAAAVLPSVLLGPVQLIVGGAGAGLRAVDGRTQQPGRGLPRPRGFRPEDAIPDAARVAVPALPAALAAALGNFGSLSLAKALGPAIELARPQAPARAAVLERLARRGPLLSDRRISGELVAAAGRLADGLLGPRDLEELRPSVRACRVEEVAGDGPAVARDGSARVATVPWGAEAVHEASAPARDASRVGVVAAIDWRGLVAIACYEAPAGGVPVLALELIAPLAAVPVLRGKTRVRPGEPLPAAAPIAVRESAGVLELAVGVGGAIEGEAALRRWLAGEGWEGASADGARLLGVLRAGEVVRPVGGASPPRS